METKAPLRISFSGGGSDIDPYCSEYGSAILAVAIDMYAYAEYPSEPHSASKLEDVITSYFGKEQGTLKVWSDALPMSGLGGSAACFVAGCVAIEPGLGQTKMGQKRTALLALYLERKVMNILGGRQDQFMSAYGGMKLLEIKGDDVSFTEIKPSNLEDLLYLVYVGNRKNEGTDILQDQINRDNKRQYEAQCRLARAMTDCIKDKIKFGKLIDTAWRIKKMYSPLISNITIDKFYNECLKHGAIGGKLPGAGGGGYMLLMEHPNGGLRTWLNKEKIGYTKIKFDYEGVRCLV